MFKSLFKQTKPFLFSPILEIAIKQEITKSFRDPGGVIVLSPKGSGKSTSMKMALRTLKIDKMISGVYYIPNQIFEPSHNDVMDSLNIHLGVPSYTRFSDTLPVTNTPIMVIIDEPDPKIIDTERLWSFTYDISLQTVSPGRGVDFQFYIITSEPNIARKLLTVNDGVKIRLLASKKEITDGDDMWMKTSWRSKGLKLKKKDIETLVDQYSNVAKNRENRDNILNLCIKSGTFDFIHKVCSDTSSKFPYNFYNNIAEQQMKEWEICAKVTGVYGF
jgi:hypothetical protein